MTTLGVIGYGYWGPNLVRNILAIKSAHIHSICDINPKTLRDIPRLYPTVSITANPTDVVNNAEIDAVVIATPIRTHYALAKEAIKNGKHVLLEKPMTETAAEAKELIRLAKKHHVTLCVDHTFLYTPAIQKLLSIVRRGDLGTIQYIDCVRTNLGLIQKDSNVISDLAPHDFSIIDAIMDGALPTKISATGYTQRGLAQESIAHISALYPKDIFVHMHVSWMSPIKIRTIMIIGSKKMLLYDDMEPSEKIKIYDKSVSIKNDILAQKLLQIGYRVGQTTAPHLPIAEGLTGVIEAFIRKIQYSTPTRIDGATGYRVVRQIVAANKSLSLGGTLVRI